MYIFIAAEEIDALIEKFQRQFDPLCSEVEKHESNLAGEALIERFYPLFKKYLTVLTTGQINFKNMEQKLFVRLFMDHELLKVILHKRISKELRDVIMTKFNFIIEAYGKQEECEIEEDLHMAFFTLAKRYNPQGKSFCCYIYNAFRYEVARLIKNFQKNPANFHYKTAELSEQIQSTEGGYNSIEDSVYENEMGIPDTTWIQGRTCSDIFADFSPTERKIFIKYYIEDWKDSQIAELLGCHSNTVNLKRKNAVKKLADRIGIKPEDIIRHRNSGKKAIM